MYLGDILRFVTRTLPAATSSLLFMYVQNLRLADSDSLSLLIHAGGKLGALRMC